MKLYLFVLSLLVSGVLFSQNEFTEKDARQLVDTFFEGFHSGDTIKMRSVLAATVPMQTAFTDKDGVQVVRSEAIVGLIDAVGKRPETQKWEERLLDYRVEIDGNLVHVWTPYEFWFNDTFSHCGANSFTIARTEEGWKIIHVIDSRRYEDCQD